MGAEVGAQGPDLADWLLRGGFPEPRLVPAVDRQLWFGSYLATYVERDVRDRLRIGDLNTFSRFVALAAARSGGVLNMTDLGRDAGVSGPTAKSWLTVLQTSRLVHLLPPYHANFGKRIVKSPKLYFLDVGLLTFLLGLHSRESVLGGPSLGPLMETAVVAEWLKAFRHRGERPELHYWKSADTEVDLVLERGGRLYGIEVKSTATPQPRNAESLAAWLRLAGPTATGVLACQVETPVPVTAGIRAVPWHLSWCGG